MLSESTNIPNYVQVYSTAKVTCTCKQFPPKKICSHSVAVAEKENVLKKFVDWLLKTNCSSNVSLTATMNLNTSRSGRKGGISKRKRGALPPITAVIDPFCGEVTSSMQRTSQSGATSASTHPQEVLSTDPPRLSCRFPAHFPDAQNCEVERQSSQNQRPQQGNNNQSQHLIWQPYLNMIESRTSNSGPAMASPNVQQNLLKPVPPGIPLPPKPPVPESNNPYFLAQIRGNISKCSGCAGSFKGAYPLPPPDDRFVIGRKEKDWFPNTQPNGEKHWKLGREQNRYYHLNPACIHARHPFFNPSQLHGLISSCSSLTTLTPELIAALRTRFG